jgi:Tfp pilus assembly protein PilW
VKKASPESGVTLAEVLIAMVGSIIVIGALLVSSIGLQKAFHASESYANSQADERRLIDWVGRDLRRAIGISACGASGVPSRLTSGTVNLDEGSSLIITLPAYYKSNSGADSSYAEALPVIAAGDRVAYGTLAGPAPAFTVCFRKLYLAAEESMCIVRDEGDTRQVIVRGAQDLQLQITLSADGESCALFAQFFSPYSRRQTIVAVHDQVMLRNARID